MIDPFYRVGSPHDVGAVSRAPRLHAIRLRFDRATFTASWCRRRTEVPVSDRDYLVHCRLVALWGDLAPRPFLSRWQTTYVEVEAYSETSAPSLLDRIAPRVDAQWWPRTITSEPVTAGPNQALHFSARVCPVVRLASARHGRSAGAEIDVFEHRSLAPDNDPGPRAQVYTDWFSARLLRAGATVVECRLDDFRLTSVLRRSQRRSHGSHRPARRFHRPDAYLSGQLRVESRDPFFNLLQRGVGRHRAFGFGLLRVATNSPM